MNVKSAQKTLPLLVIFFGLSLGLFGCGINRAQQNTNNQPATSSSPSANSASQPATGPQTSLDPAVARGLAIYNTQCIGCHGTNGSGGDGLSLLGKTPSASYIQSNMPLNKPKSLSNEQVSDLVAYLATLK